jgi:adenylyltransferase/sulfurtransferase
VLGVLPGLVALVQATETVKLLAGIGEPLIGRLLSYDALAMSFSEFELRKDPDCPICGERPTLTALVDYDGFCGVEPEGEVREKSAAEVAAMRSRGERFLLLDVREPHEFERARIEGAELVPLGRLEAEPERLAEWRERTIVIHCHKGARSARAARMLAERGFRDVWSLGGGIEAWSLTVDARVARY